MYQTRLSFLAALLVCAPCFGQDRGKLGYTNEELLGMCEERIVLGKRLPPPGVVVNSPHYSPIANAHSLAKTFEVVVDGEFLDLPAASGMDPESLNPRDELVGFRVLEVYKGSAPGSIKVELNSDMLVVPGEGLSRYAKRLQVLDALNTEIEPIRERMRALQDSFDAGEVSKHWFESEGSRLRALRKEKDRLFRGMSKKLIFRIHGETFYSLGGAIKENERFLVGIEPIPGEIGSYRLEENPDSSSVLWGEQREDVIIAWHSPEDFIPDTFYGAYDPNEDEDCETLLSLVSRATETILRMKAMQLLDGYQLVAYGEVYGVPDDTTEELRKLDSEEVRVRFRIHELFKGDAAGSIELELNSDMLSVPDEGRSRYAKRQAMREQHLAYMRLHHDRIDELRRSVVAGNLDSQIYEDELDRVLAIQNQHATESGLSELMSAREVSSWLGDTFYERGGVIQPYRSYLIGVNEKSENEHVYLLGELPESPSRIYWGEESDLVLRELEELAR